jgi:hypothetical protein
MKTTFLLSLIAVAAVTGCVQRYRVTLTNNNVMTTRSKPKLDAANGVYRFKDAQGKPAILPALRIKEIEPL